MLFISTPQSQISISEARPVSGSLKCSAASRTKTVGRQLCASVLICHEPFKYASCSSLLGPGRPLHRNNGPAHNPEHGATSSYFAFTKRTLPFPHALLTILLWSLIYRALSSTRVPFYYRIHTYRTTSGMTHALGTMSAPTPSLVRAFSQFGHPQHPIEQRESKREAVHRKRGRSLSTPSLNTREWHQFRMLDATTPHLSPCDPTLTGRPRSASLNPSPVITCTGPSLGDRSCKQVGCSQDQVEITESSGPPAVIPDEEVIPTEGQVVGHGLEHLIKRTRPNAGPLPAAGGMLESLLKRRNASRCFFSLAELHAMSSFEDSSDDGGYQVP